MKHPENKILMIFIEPTPYLLDLIFHLEKNWLDTIEVVFIKNNFSQQWDLDNRYTVLDKKNRSVFKVLHRYIFKSKYDLIFLAGWSHQINLSILLFARLFRIPTVVDSDTPLSPTPSNYKKIVKKLLYPILFKIPYHFLPAGSRQANYLRHYGVPTRKITIEKMTVNVVEIQNYILQNHNNRTFLRESLGIKDNDVIFLFIGRLIERKGILDLIFAFNDIKDPRAKCIITGDGPLKTAVENAANQNHKIIYTDWLEKKAILDLYLIADVFILPAHYEPWGLVINEAMAAGKPVIVTDQVGCVDDLVIHKNTGLIIKPHDVNALTQAMCFFLDNPATHKSYSQNELDIISQWRLEDEAEQIVKVWRNLLL